MDDCYFYCQVEFSFHTEILLANTWASFSSFMARSNVVSISSSVTTVVSFVSAGLMTLPRASHLRQLRYYFLTIFPISRA